MHSRYPRLLAFTLRFIACVQIVLGCGFFIAPAGMATVLGLVPAPGWANWLFGMMAARFLGFGYGLFIAARDPVAHLPWVRAMVGIQILDWIVTVQHLHAGDVTLAQVNTASFLPLVFLGLLAASWPRRAS